MSTTNPAPSLPVSEPDRTSPWFLVGLFHTPIADVTDAARRALTDRLESLERQWFRVFEPTAYVAELTRTEAEAAEDEVRGPQDASSPFAEPAIQDLTVALLAFMQDVFDTLRLDLYGNAPGNHGWMNRFRRWGRSRTFAREYARQRATLSPAFAEFLEHYLLRTTTTVAIDPIPHAWEVEAGFRPPRYEKPIESQKSSAISTLRGAFLDRGRSSSAGSEG